MRIVRDGGVRASDLTFWKLLALPSLKYKQAYRSVQAIASVFFVLFASTAALSQVNGYFLDPAPAPPTAAQLDGAKDYRVMNGIIYAINDTNTARANSPTLIWLPGIAGNNTVLNDQEALVAVNATGEVIGNGPNASSLSRAIIWNSAQVPWELEPLQNSSYTSTAYAISNNGIAVGSSMVLDVENIGQFPTGAVMWPAGSETPTQLPTCTSASDYPYPFDTWDDATAISPNGKYIAGTCSDDTGAYGNWGGALWKQDGTVIQLGWGGGASAVNDSGIIVGTVANFPNNCPGQFKFGCEQAEMFDSQGNGTLLPVPAAYALSEAVDVNATGTIVGDIGTIDLTTLNEGTRRAVMWAPPTLQMTDLSALVAPLLPTGYLLNFASDINDDGHISVTAINPTDPTKPGLSYTLTPAIKTTTAISSPASTTYVGQQIQFKAKVAAGSGRNPAGSVNWYDNGRLAGTTQLAAAGTTTFQPGAWGPGLHDVKASYAGQSPTASSSSGVLPHTIVATPTKTTLSASTLSPVHKQAFTLIAHVSSTYGVAIGTVAFYENGKVIAQAPLTSGARSYAAITVPTAGKDNFSAVFLGNSYYVKSTSPSLTLTVK